MSDITRITAEHYHASREDATGRVELTISGEEGAVVIDLGDDGDEILVGLLGLDECDEEGETVPDLAEMDRLKGRLEAAEAIMRQCLAAVEHAEVAHLLGLYFDAAARAAQAEQDGGQADG